jgi:hypothetical protein
MSNWKANDILLQNRKTSHRHRSDRLDLVKGQLSLWRKMSRWNEAVVSQFHRSPEIFLQRSIRGFSRWILS